MALITIRKESLERFVLSVDIETEDNGEILINKRKIVAQTVEEAVNFFASYGIGVISWLK